MVQSQLLQSAVRECVRLQQCWQLLAPSGEGDWSCFPASAVVLKLNQSPPCMCLDLRVQNEWWGLASDEAACPPERNQGVVGLGYV